ncbi:hypothetical protein FRC0552_00044 [Corynebacterium diphtheriae]|nr:hypothetical protein FRC0551_00041 [Corynebacterium diphtheriae]CAB1027448.1 hypothetical protein FRC0552_00044 [Corynebacterium diphtheriae]
MELRGAGRFPQPWLGWDWWALVGVGGRWWACHPRSPPKKTALHTKSSQTAGLEAIWCEVLCKMPRNTPEWWLGGTGAPFGGKTFGYVRVKPWAGTAAAPARPTRITRTMPSRPPMLALPPFTPEKTAFHTKSSQTAGLEAIWCEVRRKILRNTPVWWLSGFRVH